MMKNGFVFLGLFYAIFGNVNAQSTDLYIVINEARWFAYCKANGQRVHQLIDEYTQGKEIFVLSNDVTDEESKRIGQSKLEEMGILYYMQNHKEAAITFVFDAKTKKVIDKFSIKTKDDQVLAYLNKSLDTVSN